MSKNVLITLREEEIRRAEMFLNFESEFLDFNDNDNSLYRRKIGIFAEIAVTHYLNHRYSTKRITIPMGLTSRLGMSEGGFGFGDVITISHKDKHVNHYEVKAFTPNSQPIIRCNHAESYNRKSVSSVFFVSVIYHPDAECAECEIIRQVRTIEIPGWESTRIDGIDYYVMPTQ
uniref:Uncharacterized protein n=2 Tax=unclassified Caudoviricetes TaxID=2788787 RepID=A0AB39AC41_9CAUD